MMSTEEGDADIMDFNLNGKRALVTGSSRGIGSAIALELARGGADVIVHCSRPSKKADNIAQQIQDMGRKSEVITADLTNPESTIELAEKAMGVDILVLNASVQIRKPWQEITVAEYIMQTNCNYLSSLLLMQRLSRPMQEKKWGRIVAIGSVQELKPHPQMLVYSSSKCAQTGLIKSLAAQLAKDGITVNTVAPGVIYTDRNIEALSNPVYARQVTESIPVGFYGQKEDIAGTVRLLCSDFGRYITGQNIFIDGGKSL